MEDTIRSSNVTAVLVPSCGHQFKGYHFQSPTGVTPSSFFFHTWLGGLQKAFKTGQGHMTLVRGPNGRCPSDPHQGLNVHISSSGTFCLKISLYRMVLFPNDRTPTSGPLNGSGTDPPHHEDARGCWCWWCQHDLTTPTSSDKNKSYFRCAVFLLSLSLLFSCWW